MAEGKSYKGLPGWYDDSEPGLVSGTGPALVKFLEDQAVAAQKQRAWEKAGNTGTFATSESIYQSQGPRCDRCKQVSPVVTGGLCDACQPKVEPLVYVAQEVRCEICAGTGRILVPEDSVLIEKPLVPGGDDDS